MSYTKQVLVIGYGNPGRCDDGIGPAVAERLAEMDLPGLDVQTTYQLNVEDAESVAEHDIVVFIDACLCSPPPFFLRELEPRSGTREFTTHSLAPEGVLGLAHDVFGARTRGFSLAVRGYDFHAFGETLSEEAEVNVDAALSFLAEALTTGGTLFPDAEPVGAGT